MADFGLQISDFKDNEIDQSIGVMDNRLQVLTFR